MALTSFSQPGAPEGLVDCNIRYRTECALSALPQAVRALSAWGATLYGFVAILALTPLAAHAALRESFKPKVP